MSGTSLWEEVMRSYSERLRQWARQDRQMAAEDGAMAAGILWVVAQPIPIQADGPIIDHAVWLIRRAHRKASAALAMEAEAARAERVAEREVGK